MKQYGGCSEGICNLYERMIEELRSEVVFLRGQLSSRESHCREEVVYLRERLDALTPSHTTASVKHDEVHFVSYGEKLNLFKVKTNKVNHNNESKSPVQNLMSQDDSSQVNHHTKASLAPTPNDLNSNELKETSSTYNNQSEKKKRNNTDRKNVNKNSNKKIHILSDSIFKEVTGYDFREKLTNCHVNIKSVSGAKTSCMVDYANPSLRENPDHFILHVGTNNLASDNPEKIAEDIEKFRYEIDK